MRYLLFLMAILGAGCARERVIPDETLAEIFRDAYLINAYTDNRGLLLDSLELYRPVFARYGYTAENVRYTIGNFSRRKSAKLSDVVERAVEMLEAGSEYYGREVAALDTVDNVALRRYTRTLYSDTLIRVSRLKDTTRLHLRLDSLRAGQYVVSYEYLVDSLDRNTTLRARMWLEGGDGKKMLNPQMQILRKFRREKTTRILQADTSVRALVLRLGYVDRERMKTPDITLYDLKVVYTPTLQSAIDSLYYDQLGLHIFADEFFTAFAPDSLQLPLHGE
jgi:hypothetical protein